MKFVKKPVTIEAHQWFINGDHPADYPVAEGWSDHDCERNRLRCQAKGTEGAVVRRYRRPDDSGARVCEHCGNIMHAHGWIDTPQGGHVICPGDWIINEMFGGYYPCKPDVFERTYESADKARQ